MRIKLRASSPLRDHRAGFTLIELLIVIAVIVMLLALLLPALLASRRGASQVECANRLRQIGIAIHDRFTREVNDTSYCTGSWAPNFLHGDPSRVGWVADLVNSGIAPENLLCPANPATYSQALTIESLKEAHTKGRLPSTIAGDDASLLAFRDDLVDLGYNTTYCQLWYMAYTDLLPATSRKGTDPDDTLDPKNTIGPLMQRRLRRAARDAVGLIATSEPIVNLNQEYTAAITKGPVDTGDPDSELDFTSIGLLHGGSKRRQANVLFADGHVETLTDENGNAKLDREELEGKIFIFGLRPTQ